MKNMKKAFSLLMAILMLSVLMLSGCGSTDSGTSSGSTSDSSAADSSTASTESQNSGTSTSTGEKVTITFWTLQTRQEAVDPIIEAFKEIRSDIEVVASYYSTDGIKDACKVAASSGTLPDIWFNWGGSLGSFYVENGLTYDLTSYAEENGWSDIFNSGALDLCTLDGKLSGYPTSYNVLGIYYNKAIFEQYSLEVPTTFEEFEEVCATLKENGITPITTAGLNGWHVMRFVELLIEHYAGSELHDSMNTFTESYNNDAVVQALAKYQEFCEKGYFPTGFETASPDDTYMALFSGSAAMDVQGQWYDGRILQEEQDIETYGVFAFPSGETNRMSAFVEMTQYNANISEDKLEASMAFMDYYYSQENVDLYSDFYNQPLPTLDAVMPDGQDNVPVMLEMAEENGTFTITDQAFPTEVADALFDVQDALAAGQMTPEEGAAAIQAAIETYNS